MRTNSYDLREEKLFLAMYSVWLLDALVGISMWKEIALINTATDCLARASWCLLIVQFLSRKRYTRRDVTGILLIILAGILAWHSVYNRHILTTMILIYFSARVDFRKILKCTFLIQASFMLVTILASQLDVVANVIWQRGDALHRQGLGYNFCAYPAHLLLFMTLMWFCIRRDIRRAEVVLFLILNTAIYLATDSRADYFLSLIALLGFCLVRRMKSCRAHPAADFFLKYGCGILAVFSIFLQFLYDADSEIMVFLNSVLTNRLMLGKQALVQYGLPLFGQAIRWVGVGSQTNHPGLVYNYVDCAFLKELLSYGIIFLAVLIAAYYFMGKRLAGEKDYVLGWAVTVSLLYAVVNAHLLMPQYNVFVLLLGSLFGVRQQELSEEKEPLKQGFLYEMQKWAEELFTGQGKHILRILLFLALLIIPTCIQHAGVSQMVSSASLYRWIICGVLFVLAGLVYEGRETEHKKNMLWYAIAAFLILAMVSDFFVNKKFRYAPFALFAFGGLLVQAIRSMERPERLTEEFKIAFKLYFLLVLAGGIFIRRSILGFCHQGLFQTEAENAMVMLLALIVFLDELRRNQMLFCHLAGVLLSLCVLYTTGETILLLTGTFLLLVCLAVQCYNRAGCRCAKAGTVLLTVVIVSGCAALGFVFLWKLHPDNYFNVLNAYLQEINILGHSYVPKIQKTRTWTVSGIVMQIYRYGLPAGIACLLAAIGYFITSCRKTLRTGRFLPVGMAVAILVINETVAVNFPFTHVGWMVSVLAVGYALAGNEGRLLQKNEA